MYKISIIIPHYNSIFSLKYLLSTIPEIPEIQIIIVDDRSTFDNESYDKLAKTIKRKNILFLRNTSENKGAGACRNIGLNYAKGEWILFADSDDYFIEKFYNTISNYLESENDVIFFTPTSIEIESGKVSTRHLAYETLIDNYISFPNYKNSLDLKFKFFAPWSKLIKRKLIETHHIKFDEVIASNDVLFSTKVGYYMKKYEVTHKKIYCITRKKGSLTTQVSLDVYNSRLQAFIRQSNFLKEGLPKDSYDSLELIGRSMLLNGFYYKIGYVNILKTFVLMQKNNIKIFDWKLLNPYFILKKLSFYKKQFNKDKKFLANKNDHIDIQY
ncbi:glycosyltransferase family 2 protein [Carnobacterium mobile]|uniref:glycosyltransferase family 2 protein n=1 Tax=Carnobacterium mobile TaxID=2750 RepID=UPI00055217C9|nr:glycosyltransferase [Carnobacterium mobile]